MKLEYEFNEMLFQEKSMQIQRQNELMLVSNLNATLSIDGDSYCWLVGDDIQNGVAGFGKSAYEAMIDFNKNFTKKFVVVEE